jgi:hypothetical protein
VERKTLLTTLFIDKSDTREASFAKRSRCIAELVQAPAQSTARHFLKSTCINLLVAVCLLALVSKQASFAEPVSAVEVAPRAQALVEVRVWLPGG